MTQIRLFTPDDYTGVAELNNIIMPETKLTPDQLRDNDQRRDPIIKFGRWVAERDGQIVGLAFFTQFIDMLVPDELRVMVRVHPDHRQQGIGDALFAAMLEGAQVHAPRVMKGQVGELEQAALRFAAKHGFEEYGRRWLSHLELDDFDMTPHQGYEARLAERGITLKSYAELADDPERDHKFHALQTLLDQDVPTPDPITPTTFEQFADNLLGNPYFLPEGAYFAVHEGQYIGLSSLFSGDGQNLHIDLTGVHPNWRRHGIALALKLRGIEFAKARGYRRIATFNDTVNTGILSLNDRLGYIRQPAQIQLIRRFD